MKTAAFLGESIEKVHRYYGTETLEDAMKHVHAELVLFGYSNWLPVLEVCVSQNYLPENILDICMNYFLWKGDLKTSADFARVLPFWRNKGLNEDLLKRKMIPLSDFVREFEIMEEEDSIQRVLSENIDAKIYQNNSAYFYSGLKSMYYFGYLEKIMLLRIFYSKSIIYYKQIWETGIRKLKNFTPFSPGIPQEWINVYFSIVNENARDVDLFDHILPISPLLIERKQDKFLILGFNKNTGCLIRMILFRQRNDRKFPEVLWRHEMLVN